MDEDSDVRNEQLQRREIHVASQTPLASIPACARWNSGGGMNYVRGALAVGVCLMFSTLRVQLVSSRTAQAGDASLLLAADTRLAQS